MHRRLALPRLLLAALLAATAGCGDDDDGADSGGAVGTSARPRPTTAPAADELHGFVPSPLAWDDCGRDLECASLTVPLDWDDPTGATIDLAVSRIPATGDEPLGAVATNPGGPGASGNEFIEGGSVFDAALTERFDTLSWDPRGVGGSAPLDCAGAPVDEFLRLDSDPDTPAEATALDEAAEAVARGCATAAADRLPFVGTDSVARDLEAIRRAYGAPMAFVGFSYGTAIGLHHLDLFPGTMLGVVLDGVVDPTDSLTDLLRGQTVAFESVVDTMFARCPAGQEGCPDGGAEAAYDEIAAEVEDEPLDAGDDEVGPSDLATATILATYDEGFWPVLFDALGAAQGGDGSTLLSLAESYRASGAYDLYQAVSCVDSTNPSGAEAWAAFAAELEAVSPRFGAAIANEMLPCAFWPVPARPVNRAIVAEGSGPVLVVGTTGDAATPLAQAEAVAGTLADGHLLVHEGEGHTAYLSSSCVQEAVATFLLDGDVPEDGARC